MEGAEANYSETAPGVLFSGGCVVGEMVTGTDGQQIIVSTTGEFVRVKSLVAGIRAVQFVGSVSDESLQLYFKMQAKKQLP